ncbi:HYR domain-containing protein, partial [Ruegeria sp.]|uniref:HYR domain-containing protein n=1 Tax=Ruegeria sp. TaxID=1879320 RepID=UPI002322DD3F
MKNTRFAQRWGTVGAALFASLTAAPAYSFDATGNVFNTISFGSCDLEVFNDGASGDMYILLFDAGPIFEEIGGGGYVSGAPASGSAGPITAASLETCLGGASGSITNLQQDGADSTYAADTYYGFSYEFNGAPFEYAFTGSSAAFVQGAQAVPDTTPPVIGAIGDISVSTDTGMSTASVPFSTSVSDNVDASSSFTLTYTLGGSPITSPHAFPVGTSTVTVTSTPDAAGNAAAPVTFDVTVSDNEAPVIGAVSDSSVSTDPGSNTASVSFSTAVSDNVDASGTFTLTYSLGGNPITSPHAFPVGTNTVTVTSSADSAGNAAAPVTFDVTVSDGEAPVIAAVTDIAVATAAGQGTASVPFATTVSDNVDAAGSFTLTYSLGGSPITSPHVFP